MLRKYYKTSHNCNNCLFWLPNGTLSKKEKNLPECTMQNLVNFYQIRQWNIRLPDMAMDKLVTESDNVKSGHRIRQCKIWSPECLLSNLVTRFYIIADKKGDRRLHGVLFRRIKRNFRGGKLEAVIASWRLQAES